MVGAEAFGAADGNPRQLAAMKRAPSEHGPLPFETDDIGDQPPTGAQRRPRFVQQTGTAGAAADENGVWRRQAGQRLGSLAHNDSQPRDAEPRGIARDRRSTGLVAFDRDRRAAGS